VKLINYFDHFLVEKVNLNPTRMDLLDTRTTAITNFLKRDEIFGPLLKTTIPQGSFAQRTIIRPRADGTFDADVLIHLDPVPDWEWCEYVGKLYTALGRSPVYQDMRHRRTRCVYVDYADEFHVDLVPYVEIDGRGYITNRKTDSSEFTDPKGFTGWLNDQNRVAGGNLIKVIRLFKHMRDITWGFSVKSVILTTLIGERVSAVAEMLDAGCYADVPSTLRKVAADLDDYLQANPLLPAIVDPGGTQDRFDERWDQAGYTTFRAKVNALRVKADEAFYAADRDTSLAAWQAIFGAGFVAPPASTASSSRNGLIVVRGKSLVPTERFLDKDFGIPFALNGHTVTISGQVTAKDGFRPYRLKDNNFQVQKRRRLIFKVESCSVPGPYEVYWKVRNTGTEAETAGGLRGEIRKRGSQITETTAYAGPHWVECYVVRGNHCLARARHTVTIF
jgi:hypothetical protein